MNYSVLADFKMLFFRDFNYMFLIKSEKYMVILKNYTKMYHYYAYHNSGLELKNTL